MKNNFFVGIEIVFGLVFLFLIGMVSFLWFAIDAFEEELGLSILLIVMLVVVPTILLLWGIYTFAPKLYLDKNGVTKRLFGIKLKYYKWEEIDHIKFYGNPKFVTSISFYKKRDEKKLFYRFYKYERIYFSCNKKKMDILTFYAPENIKQQIGID